MGGRAKSPACPRFRMTRRRGYCVRSAMPAHLARRVHHRPQPRLFVKTGGYLLDVALGKPSTRAGSTGRG